MKKQGKKILVGGLISILVGGLIGLEIYLYSPGEGNINNKLEKPGSTTNDVEKNVTEEAIEAIIEDDLTEKYEENQLEILEEKNQEEKVEAPIIYNESNAQKNKTTQEKGLSSSNNKSNTQTSTKAEAKSSVQNGTKSTEEKTKDEQKNSKENTQQKQNVHTYKYNSSIVEKMKQDIKNNESEYMKKYGYNIVVDESIVTQTNQFTYTGNRVKDKIIYKFGTIKIYARDYYLNGNYMYTECYLI